jgi:hypothetical protein
MRVQPPAGEVRPYLELGLACAGEEDSEALALLLASQGYWDFGYGIDPADDSGERARAAAGRARDIARRLARTDLELTALDSLSSGLNIRGMYGQAEPIDRERLALARTIRDPFEVGDSFYTAAWSALAVGRYADAVALTAEFEALGLDFVPIGPLSLAVLAQVPMGAWDQALADQARLREYLGGQSTRPPSMASGGFGANAFIHEARGNSAAADESLAVIAEWNAEGQWPRQWATPLAAATLARRGDFESARRLLEPLRGSNLFTDRVLEARCTIIAEEAAWDEAADVIAEARRHAEFAQLLALPFHADRLEGRAQLAAGDAEAAGASLERAVAGFRGIGAAWEAALAELALGEALVLSGSDAAARALMAAADVFGRLGVPRELRLARALLGPPSR